MYNIAQDFYIISKSRQYYIYLLRIPPYQGMGTCHLSLVILSSHRGELLSIV